jgi:hypothetical protein
MRLAFRSSFEIWTCFVSAAGAVSEARATRRSARGGPDRANLGAEPALVRAAHWLRHVGTASAMHVVLTKAARPAA